MFSSQTAQLWEPPQLWPNGAVHEATSHPEETVYLANVHGAIAFYGEDPGDGSERPIVGISDWRGMKAIQDLQKTTG